MSYQHLETTAHGLEDQILDAAQRLLDGSAAQDFTMEQLAQESGLSRATLYRRVGSKQAVLARLARERGLEGVDDHGLDIHGRILQAARVTFGKHGLARTTMEQIAAQAGLGVATVYRHFGDRESLIRAFMRECAPEGSFHELARLDSGDIEADLIGLVTEMLTFLHDNREMIWLSVIEGAEMQNLYEQLGRGAEGARAELTRFLERAVAERRLQDQDPEQMTTALAGMLLTFALDVPVFGGPPLEDPQQAAQFIVHLFLHGLGLDDSSS